MPARIPTRIAALSTIACAVALLLAATPPASAGARGPDHDATAFDLPAQPHGVRRSPPRPAYHRSREAGRAFGRPGYGSPALVRAYLPRNHAVPMYNEPPAR